MEFYHLISSMAEILVCTVVQCRQWKLLVSVVRIIWERSLSRLSRFDRSLLWHFIVIPTALLRILVVA